MKGTITVGGKEYRYAPQFPSDRRFRVGIVGCGNIVKTAHLPAYKKYGVEVKGVFDVRPEAAREACEAFGIGVAYSSLEALLGDPQIEIVDIATHPDVRTGLIHQALDAGKHVLAQKPLATTVHEARDLVQKAERLGLKLAVNQNGRWAPPWRLATQLAQDGTIGDVIAVTHLYDMNFSWMVGSHFDGIEHVIIYDYSIHWFDISRCWLADRAPLWVRAREYRMPNQPEESISPWGMSVEISFEGGATAVIRGVGSAASVPGGHPFWVHGTRGTLRGSLHQGDFLECELGDVTQRFRLDGAWFHDGFAGTMGELMCAIAEDREPFNSGRHNLRSLAMTLAACRSADRDGAPEPVEI